MRGGGRGRPIQGNLARAAIVAEIVRLGGKQLRQIAREGGMGNAIRKEFGQGSHMKSALGAGTPRAKKIVKVVPVQCTMGRGSAFFCGRCLWMVPTEGGEREVLAPGRIKGIGFRAP